MVSFQSKRTIVQPKHRNGVSFRYRYWSWTWVDAVQVTNSRPENRMEVLMPPKPQTGHVRASYCWPRSPTSQLSQVIHPSDNFATSQAANSSSKFSRGRTSRKDRKPISRIRSFNFDLFRLYGPSSESISRSSLLLWWCTFHNCTRFSSEGISALCNPLGWPKVFGA